MGQEIRSSGLVRRAVGERAADYSRPRIGQEIRDDRPMRLKFLSKLPRSPEFIADAFRAELLPFRQYLILDFPVSGVRRRGGEHETADVLALPPRIPMLQEVV